MIPLLAMLGVARADPLALRAAGPASAPTLVAGWPRQSVGAWLAPAWALAATIDEGASGALTVAWRHRLVGDETGAAWELGVAGGPVLPWLTPGLAIELGPWTAGAWRGEHVAWTGSLAAPAALRVLGPAAPVAPELRVPVLLGTSLALRLGPLWLGPQAEAGLTLHPGRPLSAAGQLGIALALH